MQEQSVARQKICSLKEQEHQSSSYSFRGRRKLSISKLARTGYFRKLQTISSWTYNIPFPSPAQPVINKYAACMSESRDICHSATPSATRRVRSATPPNGDHPEPWVKVGLENNYINHWASYPPSPTAQENQFEFDLFWTLPLYRRLIDVDRIEQWRRKIPPDANDGGAHGLKKHSRTSSNASKIPEDATADLLSSPSAESFYSLWSNDSGVEEWDSESDDNPESNTWITADSLPDTVQYPAGRPLSEYAGCETEAAYSSLSESKDGTWK
jgi:hypothetical protein